MILNHVAAMARPLVALRPVIEEDIAHFFQHSRDEDAIRMAKPEVAIADWEAFKKKWDRIRADNAFFCRSVVEDDRVAGYIAHFQQMDVPSVSYWFGRRFWGRGLAQQALKLFIAEIDRRPLYARVASDNHASLRVLTHNGFSPFASGSYFCEPVGRDVSEIVLRLDS